MLCAWACGRQPFYNSLPLAHPQIAAALSGTQPAPAVIQYFWQAYEYP